MNKHRRIHLKNVLKRYKKLLNFKRFSRAITAMLPKTNRWFSL